MSSMSATSIGQAVRDLRSDRLKNLTSAVFAKMDAARRVCLARGIDVINLSIGSPDLTPAPHVLRRLHEALDREGNYGYPMRCLPEFHEAVASWYRRRFGVVLDPETEVQGLMGSQDGLAHVSLAFCNPGDLVMVPDPGYPIYSAGPLLSGAKLYPLPLLVENAFLPDLESIDEGTWRKTKILIINYPNNPVSAVAGREFYEKVVEIAARYGIVVCHDAAYSELAFDGYRPMSFLEVPGAREVGIEFNSLSKTFNMAGCRIGYAVGNPGIIAALAEVKNHLDYGIFRPVQEAAIAALTGPQESVAVMAKTYERRRDVLVDGLRRAGWDMPKSKATMFVWAPVPGGQESEPFALELLARTGVVVVPGSGFGPKGEGYVRIALVKPDNVMAEAVRRIESSGMF